MTLYKQRNFFELINSEMFFESPLLITSVHSGNIYPDIFLKNLSSDLDLCRSMEDMYVNDLLDKIDNKKYLLIKNYISRSVIDLNRKVTEIDKSLIEGELSFETEITSLTNAGIGLFPFRAIKGDIMFKRKFKANEINHMINSFYHPWHDNLKKIIKSIYYKFNKVLILDMHSMPDSKNLPDFVIGNRYGKSCDSYLTSHIADILVRMGYSVGHNDPYAGGFITQQYYDDRKNISTLQLEINRKLYMNENNFSKNGNFNQLRSAISILVEDISEILKEKKYKRIINE